MLKPRNYAEYTEQFVDPNESAMERAVYSNVAPEEDEDDEVEEELPVRYDAP